KLKCGFNHFVHVIIFVLRKSSAKKQMFLIRKVSVFLIKFLIFIVINRIIRLHTLFPVGRIFFGNHSFLLSSKFKVLMLNNPGIRSFSVGIIDNRHTLMIFLIKHFRLKFQTPVLQLSKTISVICIQHSGIEYLLTQCIVFLFFLVIVNAKLYIASFKQSVNQNIVPADRNSLIKIVK